MGSFVFILVHETGRHLIAIISMCSLINYGSINRRQSRAVNQLLVSSFHHWRDLVLVPTSTTCATWCWFLPPPLAPPGAGSYFHHWRHVVVVPTSTTGATWCWFLLPPLAPPSASSYFHHWRHLGVIHCHFASRLHTERILNMFTVALLLY